MYLSTALENIEVVLGANTTTSGIKVVASFQDITSAGMTLPQSSTNTNITTTSITNIVNAPAASTTRQITHISIYNQDTVASTVTVQKDDGTNIFILCKRTLQPGDTLEWSRESGWNLFSASSAITTTFTNFTSNGTWTKPAGLKRAMVICVAGGGGGGSGRQGAAGENRFGGGAGGGGAVTWRMLSADDLPATISVTVGIGGTGGAGQTAASTNGNAGNGGTNTSFGALVVAAAANGGNGGTTTAGGGGNGGQAQACITAHGPFSLSGNSGGAGNSATGSNGTTGFLSSLGCAAGGGGAGISSANATGLGGNGGGVISLNVVQTGPTAGASPNGTDDLSNFLFFNTSLTSGIGLGTGGAGGSTTGNTNAGNAGRGAGGGGGRASLNGTTSGAGGNGGNGLCVVLEMY